MKKLLSTLTLLALGIVIGSALGAILNRWWAMGILLVIIAIALIELLTSKE